MVNPKQHHSSAWSATHEHRQGERWHLWAELSDENGQPIRHPGNACAYIVAAFGASKEAASAKIERDKPLVEARYYKDRGR